ncbi:MAG: CPBP family intramembrane glutamic endopeptidase, partial [Pedobacter sp.]|nr:CPBP family intramembrane glutamic endopeptidase [Pedobacter sp.]
SEVCGVLIVLGALLMIFRIYAQYGFEDVFIVRHHRWSALAKGMAIGFALVSLSVLLAQLNGNVHFSFRGFDPIIMAGYFLLYALVGVLEEFIFRSFPLLALSERYPNLIGILLTSVLFGLAHFANPGFSWLAMVNISLVGICLAIFVLLKKNIYWAVGIHLGWNYTQGVLLGYKVSGTDSIGVLDAKPIGPTYLSGGVFGIESSIFCTLVILVLIAYLLFRYRLEPVREVVFEEEFMEE